MTGASRRIGARLPLAAALVCAGLVAASASEARVTKITLVSRESPTYAGRTFGAVGPYERIIGTASGEIDPADRHNAIIQDIQLAPRNANGKVEYTASFTLVKPVDMSKANGILFYNINNRGSRNFPYNNGGDPGDGFVQNDGYTLLWSGWQGDVVPAANNGNEWVQVPTASNADGSPVTGPVIYRVSNIAAGTNTISLASVPPGGFTAFPYRPLTLDTTQAKAETHAAESETAVTGAVTPIASGDWAFADCRTVAFPGTPDASRICLRNGFDPSLLYQFTFTAKDPLVLGVGLAAYRDVISFFRYEAKDDAGTANPVAGLSHVLVEGTSQSGNLLKTSIHLGFNEDEKGRIVAEGANPHIAARQTPVNFRFALPGGAGTLYEPGSEPVLWWEDYTDTVRSRAKAGMLDRCRASNTCPKMIETFGATEFWDLRMGPGLYGTDAKADIPLPDNMRRYYFPGTSHGGGGGAYSITNNAAAGAGGTCQFQSNPNNEVDYQRALFTALKDWVVFGTQPPPSIYPKIGDGTLVASTKAAMGFPDIPGLPFKDNFENTMLDYAFGASFIFNDMSGVIANEPPAIKQAIPTLVPKVNQDGNEIAGLQTLMDQLPLGTYLGWNIVTSGFNKGRICAFTGGFVPFAKIKADRIANNDPRLSIEERYPSFSAFYYKAAAAVNGLIAQRYLLPADGAREFSTALSDMLRNGLVPKDALAEKLIARKFITVDDEPATRFDGDGAESGWPGGVAHIER
ncbi:MAG TPA: alpha/beta hydrolase domain-containing protein [Casimicrobiaceae bacterium]|nr:alpha/beta hydrolase domain-containing protein [Casimicrobiaceae bacterium]